MARITEPDGPITGSDNFFISNILDVQGVVTNTSSSLILSSSEIFVTGNLDIIGDLTVNGVEISTEVTGSDNFFVNEILDVHGKITNFSGTLVLSSSLIDISGTLLVGESAGLSDYPNARMIVSRESITPVANNSFIGLIAEAAAEADGNIGIGIFGRSQTGGTSWGYGGYFFCKASDTSDTGGAVGISADSFLPHVSGSNIGGKFRASGGADNYALYLQAGDIITLTDTNWFLKDNSATALSFDAENDYTGLLVLDTTNNSEQVRIGVSASSVDFPYARAIISQENTGYSTVSFNMGLVAEAAASELNAKSGAGLYGVGQTNGAWYAVGVTGRGRVGSSSDTNDAVGIQGISLDTHVSGTNIGVVAWAQGGADNYAIDIPLGNIRTGLYDMEVDWDLADNTPAALSFDSTGHEGLLVLNTTNNSEQVEISGNLEISGRITNNKDRLIFSSSVGSIVHISGGLNVNNINTTAISASSISSSVNPFEIIVGGNSTKVGNNFFYFGGNSNGLYSNVATNMSLTVGGVAIAVVDTYGLNLQVAGDRYTATSTGYYELGSCWNLYGDAKNGNLYLTNTGKTQGIKLDVSSSDGELLLTDESGGDLRLKLSNVVYNSSGTLNIGTDSQVVDTFLTSSYRTAEYLISANSGTYYQSEKIIVIHDNSIVGFSEYGLVTVGVENPFVYFEVAITGSNVDLRASGSAPETNVKIARTALTV